MVNAIAAMASTLAADRPSRSAHDDAGSKVGAMRVALADCPKTSRELAAAAGVPTSSVVACLKGDLATGRVRHRGQLYELSPEWDADMEEQLAAARSLLRRHGWKVTREGKS